MFLPLRRVAADARPAPLHERHSPILELNRVAIEKSLATRRLGKKIPEILLRLVGFSYVGLQ